MIADLTRQGKLVAGSAPLWRSPGSGSRRARARPRSTSTRRSSQEDIAGRQVDRRFFGTERVYLAGLFQRWGIADQIKPKLVQVPSGMAVGDVVARGDAEIGFQQVSELLPIKGIDFVGPLPADIQEMTVFSAGLHTAASAPDAAKALVKFLAAPEAAAAIKKAGMQPG